MQLYLEWYITPYFFSSRFSLSSSSASVDRGSYSFFPSPRLGFDTMALRTKIWCSHCEELCSVDHDANSGITWDFCVFSRFFLYFILSTDGRQWMVGRDFDVLLLLVSIDWSNLNNTKDDWFIDFKILDLFPQMLFRMWKDFMWGFSFC